MPLIRVQVIEGTLSAEKKQEVISRVSEVVAEIEARPHPMEKLLPYTTCNIDEVSPSNWGSGGQPVSLESLKAILES